MAILISYVCSLLLTYLKWNISDAYAKQQRGKGSMGRGPSSMSYVIQVLSPHLCNTFLPPILLHVKDSIHNVRYDFSTDI